MARALLNQRQWNKIAQLLPGKSSDSGVTAQDNRRFIEAVLWIARTGSPWRDLPAELGNWHTYTRFNRWCRRGRWQEIMSALEMDKELCAIMIDSTVVRAHQHAAGAQKKQGHKPSGALAGA